MTRKTTRRQFIQHSAVALGTAWWVSGQTVWSAPKSPNEKVRFACIGVGGKGRSDSADAARYGVVVAICDVDKKTLAKAAARPEFAKAKQYQDYRKLFDEMADKFDAVTVSTPDHHHAAATAMAIKLGKHCYTQKPLTHSIYEAKVLGDLAAKYKVQTQMGNQGTAVDSLRIGAKLIQKGIIGTVKEVHVWTNRPIWPQGIPRPKPAPVPPNLDWDVWLGPAPKRPYAPGYHPFKWRGWWDFGTGALGDMACHTVNLPYMALDLKDPVSVQAWHSGHNRDSYPNSSKIKYEFPATDKRPAVVMWWYDGGNFPPADLLPKGWKMPKTGSLFIGEKGIMLAPGDYGGGRGDYLKGKAIVIIPKEAIEKGVPMPKNKDVVKVKTSEIVVEPDGKLSEAPKVEFDKSPGHFKELVVAIQGGPAPKSNFPGYASGLTQTILLGNLAIWTTPEPGPTKKIEWDAKNLVAKNAPEVQHIVKPVYREGWTL